RPMATQKVGFDGDLWFFTRLDSPKIFEIKKDQHVNLSYARPEKHVYVSISGRGEVVRNAAKHQQLWRPALRAWFPEGLSDPQLCLIRVRVDKAESWEFGAGRLVHAIGLVRALAGRKPFVPSGAQNQKIDLTRAA
ncbi:MAG: pyridoxamine 5'-phosphate oxidase family protein, partial [Bdellovibrionota bacterium]